MRINRVLISAAETIGALFYPPHCAVCGDRVEWGLFLCEPCVEALPRLEAPFCDVCSQSFSGAVDAPFRCANCGERRFHFRFAVAACRSRGPLRDLVHRFKYQKQYYLRHPLGEIFSSVLEDRRLMGWAFDVIVPVPLHATRRRARGYNQSQALAERLSERCGRPVGVLLDRVRATRTQTHFDRADRMENLRGAFSLRKNASVRDLRILLVDDVLTTGSTLEECARVLMASGAAEVRAAVVARS